MRQRAHIATTIWSDDDFLALTPTAQWLYLFLLSQPKLSIVGAIDINLERWAKKAHGLTVDQLEPALKELELSPSRFVLVDHDDYELVVRTIVKHDPARSYKAAIGMWNAWKAIASKRLRVDVLAEMPRSMWQFTNVSIPEEAERLRPDTPIPEPDDTGIPPPEDTHAGASHPSIHPSSPSLPTNQPSSSSSAPIASESQNGQHAPPPTLDDDERIRNVIELVINLRRTARDQALPNKPITDNKRWSGTTRLDVVNSCGESIMAMLDAWPTASNEAIADAVFAGRKKPRRELKPGEEPF